MTDFVTWITIDDDRACTPCLDRHGRTWPAGAVHPTPPEHPHCRCSLLTSDVPPEPIPLPPEVPYIPLPPVGPPVDPDPDPPRTPTPPPPVGADLCVRPGDEP